MSTLRKTTDQEKSVFRFLNNLRESGITNMFGAAHYIEDEFPNIDKRESSRLLALWMDNFDESGSYEEVKI